MPTGNTNQGHNLTSYAALIQCLDEPLRMILIFSDSIMSHINHKL